MDFIKVYSPCLKADARITAMQDMSTVSVGGVKSPYAGTRIDSGGSAPYRGHKGIDFGVPTGTPVYAPVAGHVWTTHYERGGNRLTITMADGTKVGFNHLSRFAKRSGKVNKGDLVAYSGNTGTATTGPHLHVDVFNPDGLCFDAWPFAVGGGIKANGTPSKGMIYRVQIGAYKVKANADRQLIRARSAGFADAFLATGTDGIHRVQIGAFEVRGNAERCLSKAKTAGFKDAYIREVVR